MGRLVFTSLVPSDCNSLFLSGVGDGAGDVYVVSVSVSSPSRIRLPPSHDSVTESDAEETLDAEGERRVDACTIIQLIGGISRAIAGASPALIAARLYTT